MTRSKIALCLLACATTVAAQQPAGADYVIRNFKFESGETLPELKIHYIALGTPRKDAGGIVRNAVIVMHGTT
jgi:homoserine O-acetyltransferase